MTVRKYSFLLANSSHKSIWELYVLAKYGNFVLNIQNFEKTPQTFLNEYQKSNWFLKKKVICQNSSQTVLTPAIIWELFAKKSADRPNCHYSSVTFSTSRQKSSLIIAGTKEQDNIREARAENGIIMGKLKVRTLSINIQCVTEVYPPHIINI